MASPPRSTDGEMEETTTAIPVNRSSQRNVWIEFSCSPGVIRGGLCASNNFTRAQFLNVLDLLYSVNGGYQVHLWGTTAPITRTNQRLFHGQYILTPNVSGNVFHISDERMHPRTLSVSSTRRDARFREQVRARDGRCVITGEINYEVPSNNWAGFETAHIFPLALDSLFINLGYPKLVKHNDPPGINSPQNGILLNRTLHAFWDNYSFSVNPDDGYKVYSFRPNARMYHGRVLQPHCRRSNDPIRVLDVLLRWHFEQAVLCNMRGAGEPMFEFDFPPGTDMMGEILSGPLPAERLEGELFNRLYGWEQSREAAEGGDPTRSEA